MNIILFGGTGFLGSHVAEQLSLAGHDITCIVRSSSDTHFLKQLGIPLLTLDFSDTQQITRAIKPNSYVINCIADTRSHASYQQRSRVEIDLVSRLFAAAQQQHAKRFLQLSTVMVYGFNRPTTPINESHPTSPTYIYNKIADDRERTLMSLHPHGNTELVLLRPSNALGKRDRDFLPNFVRSHKSGVFPVVNGGDYAFSCIDARDVGRAMAHLLTVDITKPEVFLVKGFDTGWLALKQALDNMLGKSSRLFSMPKTFSKIIARLMEAAYPYGTHPPLTRFNLAVLSTDTLFDDKKIRDTGFTPRYSLPETLTDALADIS